MTSRVSPDRALGGSQLNQRARDTYPCFLDQSRTCACASVSWTNVVHFD